MTKEQATSTALLRKTLVEAGLTDSEARTARVVDWSPDDPTANVRVHARTNETILEMLRRDSLGACVHVTGGARALTDSYHRQVCEAMLWDDMDPFQVLYHVPEDKRIGDDWRIVEWNLEVWRSKGFSSWRQKLLTLDMIGKGGVVLKAFDEIDRIQYSIFGQRYAQIQSKHAADAKSKHVWLVESSDVNGRLAELANEDLRKAKPIREERFKAFVSTIFSNSARRMLVGLTEGTLTTREELTRDELVELIDPSPDMTLNALLIMGLAEGEADQLQATKDGCSFLDG